MQIMVQVFAFKRHCVISDEEIVSSRMAPRDVIDQIGAQPIPELTAEIVVSLLDGNGMTVTGFLKQLSQ